MADVKPQCVALQAPFALAVMTLFTLSAREL